MSGCVAMVNVKNITIIFLKPRTFFFDIFLSGHLPPSFLITNNYILSRQFFSYQNMCLKILKVLLYIFLSYLNRNFYCFNVSSSSVD